MLEGFWPCAASFVLFSLATHELHNRKVSIGQSVHGMNTCRVNPKNSKQKHTTKTFVKFYLFSLFEQLFHYVLICLQRKS